MDIIIISLVVSLIILLQISRNITSGSDSNGNPTSDQFDILELVRSTGDDLKSIVIIGLGRLGSWTAIKLAELGVNRFVFVDRDKVTEDIIRIHRMVPYEFFDLGDFKVDALKRIMQEKFPEVRIKRVRGFIHPGLPMEKIDNSFGDSVLTVWALDTRIGLKMLESPLIMKRINVVAGMHADIGGGHVVVHVPYTTTPCPKHTLGLESFDQKQELKAGESGITVEDVHKIADCTARIVTGLIFHNARKRIDLQEGNFLTVERLEDGRYREIWSKPAKRNCIFCGNQ